MINRLIIAEQWPDLGIRLLGLSPAFCDIDLVLITHSLYDILLYRCLAYNLMALYVPTHS